MDVDRLCPRRTVAFVAAEVASVVEPKTRLALLEGEVVRVGPRRLCAGTRAPELERDGEVRHRAIPRRHVRVDRVSRWWERDRAVPGGFRGKANQQQRYEELHRRGQVTVVVVRRA